MYFSIPTIARFPSPTRKLGRSNRANCRSSCSVHAFNGHFRVRGVFPGCRHRHARRQNLLVVCSYGRAHWLPFAGGCRFVIGWVKFRGRRAKNFLTFFNILHFLKFLLKNVKKWLCKNVQNVVKNGKKIF